MNTDQNLQTDDQMPEPTDIFLWANQADAHKDELEIDLFLFTKGYTVYATNYAKELKAQLKVLFLYEMISQVQTGAATGMQVRDFEAAAAEDNVLERTTLDRVDHAQEVIEQIRYGEETLEVFREGDHEFKKRDYSTLQPPGCRAVLCCQDLAAVASAQRSDRLDV